MLDGVEDLIVTSSTFLQSRHDDAYGQTQPLLKLRQFARWNALRKAFVVELGVNGIQLPFEVVVVGGQLHDGDD